MSNEDKTVPPIVDRAENAAKSVYQWSVTHTIAATAIGAFVAGFIVGKIF